MTPLCITATLDGPIMGSAIRLDALLMAAVARRDRLPPPEAWGAQPMPEVQIPVARSDCGRIYLASSSVCEEERGGFETVYVNRRFPAAHAVRMAPRMRRVDQSSGLYKSYRIPRQVAHLVGDRVTWWCLGEREPVLALLHLISALGKRHAAGFGTVRAWSADPCDPWPGFPVVRDGRPLRPLPLDWPGLSEWDEEMAALMPPCWDRRAWARCAV